MRLWSIWLSGILLIALSFYATQKLPSSIKDQIKNTQMISPRARSDSGTPTITIFTAPSPPLSGSVGARQVQAIRSWIGLSPNITVVLFAQDPSVISFAGQFGSRVSAEPEIDFTFLGTPYFHSMVARSLASLSDISVIIDPETILLPDFILALSYAHKLDHDWLLVSSSRHVSYFPFHLDKDGKHWLGEDGNQIKTRKLQGFLDKAWKWKHCEERMLLAWNNGDLPLHSGVLPPFLFGKGLHNSWVINEALSSKYRFVFDASLAISNFYLNPLDKGSYLSFGVSNVTNSGNRSWESAGNLQLGSLYGALYFHEANYSNMVKFCMNNGQYLFVNSAEATAYPFRHQRSLILRKEKILGSRIGKKVADCVNGFKSLHDTRDCYVKDQLKPSNSLSLPYSLEMLLYGLSDKNRTVVLAIAGYNYKDMLMSWVCRLKSLLISNFLVCALDPEIYEFAILQGLPVFKDSLAPTNISFNDCHFGTQCFQRVTKVKSRLVLQILKLGYNVLLSDVDVYWFKNPLPFLYSFGPSVLVAQSDEYNQTGPINVPRRLNSGFYFARNDVSTVAALEKVVKHAATSNLSEQPSFYDTLCGEGGSNRVGHDRCFEPETNLTVHFLDRDLFPNGAYQGLWEGTNPKTICKKKGCFILHNNWISGRRKKLERQMLLVYLVIHIKEKIQRSGIIPQMTSHEHALPKNLPHDANKLLAVPSPIGGVLVLSANTVHYHSQSASCMLALNNFAVSVGSSQEVPRSSFSVELDAANATWLLNDVAMLSTKTGELLLLTLVYDGRVVQRLDLSKSRASVLTSGMATLGNSLFFLGSRLGDSLLVQFSCGIGASALPHGLKEEVADVEGEIPSAKRLRRSPSDALLEMVNGEELSLYGSGPSNAQSAQKTFSFAVRDSLINVGPLKDFSNGLRVNADLSATGIAKQSNYELVCCSGHGKNGTLCVLQQSIRPETITQEQLPGCKGLWTVYHKNTRSHSVDSAKMGLEDDEYHAYLIISLETRTMVLEAASNLEEVTETVDYYVQGSTIAAGNLFGRRRVVQVFARGARILDGAFMTQDLSFRAPNSEAAAGSETLTVSSVAIADPYVLLKMTDGSIQLLVGDPSTCMVSSSVPTVFESSKKRISACTLYHDKGPEPWLRKTSTDAWLSTGIEEAIDGTDGTSHDQGDIYCVVCYESGTLEIFDVPNFSCVFSVDAYVSGKTHLLDTFIQEPSGDPQKLVINDSEELPGQGRKENTHNLKVVELTMQRWSGQHSRPYLFGILMDGTILCYHAYLFEASEIASKNEEVVSVQNSVNFSSVSTSRLRNLRFVRVPLDSYAREETLSGTPCQRITIFKNVGGYQGLFLSGSRPAWFMIFRERLRVHPQLCDGPIVAFAVLHNVNCNHGLIYVTSQGILKICQLPSVSCYDNYWPVQKIPLKCTPHQVTYFAEKNLYPLIVSVPVLKPLNQVLSSLIDQEAGQQIEHDSLSFDGSYSVDEFEVRIMEPEKSGGPWQTRATIPMQTSENALTVRVVTLFNTTTKENATLLAIGTAYVQGEDVAARGRVLLFSVDRDPDNSQTVVSEVYSKESKGAISALASLQGHLLIASGPKITINKWTGSELTGVAFFDVPALYVVSINIVKNFILLGDIHKSIYFFSWKEPQLSLLAKDFGSLDCFATEFLIDGSTLSLMVSDEQKNVQIFYYAPKMSESWKGQKLLSRAEFHVGAHVTKFLRLQMLPTSSDRTNAATSGSDKTNRFALVFGTLDGSIGCIAPLDELTFRRLQSLQKKLIDVVPHVAGLNPRSFRQFHSNGKAHRPGPDSIVDFELLCDFEMIPLEEQLEIAQQIGTTRSQIISNLNDLTLGTSFL